MSGPGTGRRQARIRADFDLIGSEIRDQARAALERPRHGAPTGKNQSGFRLIEIRSEMQGDTAPLYLLSRSRRLKSNSSELVWKPR